MHMHNATTKPRNQREANKTYKANQRKVSDQKGSKGVTNPKLPSQASKGVLLKRFGENICGLPL
jgi:hypothetical protein